MSIYTLTLIPQGKKIRWIFNLHSQFPLDLPSDPLHMEPSLLSGSRFRNKRARLSVLTHNQIIIGEEGVLANSPEDIEEFGDELSNDVTGDMIDANTFNNEMISFMDPITATGIMFSFNDIDKLNFDPPWISEEINTLNGTWRLEDWLDDFLKKAQS
jgi:hypothetical protein